MSKREVAILMKVMQKDIIIAKSPANKYGQSQSFYMYLVIVAGKFSAQAYRIIHQQPTNTEAYHRISHDKYVLLGKKFSIDIADIKTITGSIGTKDFRVLSRKFALILQKQDEQVMRRAEKAAIKSAAKRTSRISELAIYNGAGKQRQYIRFVQGGSVSPK